ncbi:DnaJ domain-containing protein [Marinomonas sp. C2222]|uniref:DnaJ domain-containing protein n=1 Tax=Marinomonas sargassi TaxID=2984494 RepID=A0ABT2YSF1_9GAMM|nr:DnaJ domain-containing protein [Marinomonas sargassi]MCV2402819.1 DnaJ domain-containing protein [Marinomonas sargassi]
MSLIDDYELLDIPTTATEKEAKAAFRRLARQYHPDKNPDTDTTEIFQRLQSAYESVVSAIRQGSKTNDWKPFSFNEAGAYARQRKTQRTTRNTDKEQEAFIKERQRAYEEMKRNNAVQEKAKHDAINAARNTLNERRMKALYEEALKSSKEFAEKNRQYSHDESYFKGDIPPYQSFVDDDEDIEAQQDEAISHPIRLDAAKAAFRACTYIACFAAGIYGTLHWQSSSQTDTANNKETDYVSGLYPQFRSAINHTLHATNLYAEPDRTSTVIRQLPEQTNLQSIKMQGDWLTIRHQGMNGWVEAKDIGFGSIENALSTGCMGYPGVVPDHGESIGEANGKSRLRILNQLPQHSLLTFESYDGKAPFSIYLHARQSYAANYIPRGQYRLVLETGSLYHQACNRFLFNYANKVILENVDFASTEQSLALKP